MIKMVLDKVQFQAVMDEKLRKAKKSNVVKALLIGGRMLQADSQRIVPVDTGQLKGSADTRVAPEVTPAVDVSYSTKYAIYVHENTRVAHNTPAHAQAKFLETPARLNREEYVQAIKRQIL